MRSPLSIRARTSLLFAGSAAAVLMIAGVLFEHALGDRFLKEDTVELRGKMDVVQKILLGIRTRADEQALAPRMNDVVSGHPGIVIFVRADAGPVFASGDPRIGNQLAAESVSPGDKPAMREFGSRAYRYLVRRVPLKSANGADARAVIALDVTDDQKFVADLRRYLWTGMATVFLVLGWLGWVVVRHGLAPLRRVSTQVAAVSTKQLDQPLELEGVPQELRELVAAFNAMLARLHESFRRLTEFSSDIAHELRTPIHNLLIQTQVALGGAENLAEYRAVLQSNEEEYQRLSKMISDMLFLAKADNRQVSLKREAVDLASEVASLFEYYEALASERNIRLVQDGHAIVSADRAMIRRALSNLLSNALRFTPQGMAISVHIGTERGTASLSVANPGREIPADQRERVFERFYRIDPSRREGDVDNVGLGLAITRSIIEMHGGRIAAESANGRVTFLLTLPSD
jgi:two-component system, OmpR family, heavy metal sensor histidine kinase CusS